MAYDEELAERVRGHLGDRETHERKMFGGLAFLTNGHMGVTVSREGGLMVRCEPSDAERLLTEPGASRMVMRGKELDGWLRVTAEAVEDDAVLARWVETGQRYAEAQPPK
jgi:TfoX/Sxy family transcriptional regulator of competence genes